MTLANKKTSLPRPQSPTLSDGSHPKRPHLASEEFDPDEKFEKLRRIDSPTESAVSHPIQFSPQHIGMSLSGKGSPKDQPTKRSVSPKAMYPPSIQKFLNGKSTITIEEAIEKLKTPSNKTHKGQLEKMKMLGAFQKKEVASNVAFRKAYSNSPASLSPARSTSPIGSPMVTSPRQDTFQNNDNFEMRVDEGDSGIPGISEGAIGKMNFPQQNVENWLNSMMGPGTGNNIFPQDQNQTGLFNAPFGNQGPSRQMSQGNYQGNNGNQMQGNQRPVNNNNQYNQFNQNPSQLTSQAQAFLKNLQGPSTSMTNYKEEDSRDRTNSFLRSPNESSYRSLADTQLSAIQSMIKATRTISPSEPNRGLMATFQKRNSNPESNMMNNGPMFQQQQPLFDNRVNTFNQNQNTMQGFGGGFNGQMQQQYPQYDNNNNNQQVHGQGMFGMQNQGVQMNQNVYNNDNNLKREYPQQQQQQQQQSNGFGGFGNQEMKSGMETYPQEQMEWNAPIQFDQGQDPEGFLMFGKNESEDFDLNIIPSDVNFMPNRHPMEELMDNDNQLMMPEAAGMDAFFNNPHGMFRYNS